MKDKKTFKTKVENCARCGGNHAEIVFKKFTHPPERYTYWAICPTNGEPILMLVVD